MNSLLIEENKNLDESGVYIGYLILAELERSDKISIFDLYGLVRKKVENVNYINTMNGLLFLRMLGLIDFKAPYITRL